jgi:Na+-driven multidrug efflux pump
MTQDNTSWAKRHLNFQLGSEDTSGIGRDVTQQIRTILLNQYIGAIATGYVIGRGIEALFAGFMPAFNTLLAEALGRRFVEDPWVAARVSLVSNLILAGLYFLVAFLLASWLYSKPDSDDDR